MEQLHTLLERLVALQLDVRIWSARKKLRAEDLRLGGELPPAEVVSLGSKRICAPEPLQVFHRLKSQAERACLQNGTRFLGGYAIAAERLEPVLAQVRDYQARFEAARHAFLAGYDVAVTDWVARHPRWEVPIRRAVEPVAGVAARLQFAFHVFRIAPTGAASDLEDRLARLGDGLFEEVAQLARRTLEESVLGQTSLSQRALGTFRRVREKLACLSFVDQRIEPVLQTLDDWLGRLPARGAVAGSLFNEGLALALLVSDAQRLRQHGAGVLAQPDPDTPAKGAQVEPQASFEAELDALFGPLPSAAPGAGPAVPARPPATFYF